MSQTICCICRSEDLMVIDLHAGDEKLQRKHYIHLSCLKNSKTKDKSEIYSECPECTRLPSHLALREITSILYTNDEIYSWVMAVLTKPSYEPLIPEDQTRLLEYFLGSDEGQAILYGDDETPRIEEEFKSRKYERTHWN